MTYSFVKHLQFQVINWVRYSHRSPDVIQSRRKWKLLTPSVKITLWLEPPPLLILDALYATWHKNGYILLKHSNFVENVQNHGIYQSIHFCILGSSEKHHPHYLLQFQLIWTNFNQNINIIQTVLLIFNKLYL